MSNLSIRCGVFTFSFLFTCLLGYGQTSQPTSKPVKEAYISYKGKPRTKTWYDKQWSYFRDKLIIYKGKVYEAGKGPNYKTVFEVCSESPIPGTGLRKIPKIAKVFQIFGVKSDEILIKREAIERAKMVVSSSKNYLDLSDLVGNPQRQVSTEIINYGNDPEVTFHIEGWTGPIPSEGKPLKADLVYIGRYQYSSAIGGLMDVQSYVPYQKISKEEFIKALENGFQLVQYNWSRSRRPEHAKPEQLKRYADAWNKDGVVTYRVTAKPVE